MSVKQEGSAFAREVVIYVVVALLAVVVMWLLPSNANIKIVVVILGIGIFFDLVSLFFHVMTIVTGKYMSGFPIVGLLFYVLFLLTSRFSLAGWNEISLGGIMLYKIVDALILLAFHMGCQLPMRFQKPREHYE
jgi:hypothetical protein